MQFCPAEKNIIRRLHDWNEIRCLSDFGAAGFGSSETWLNMNDSSANTVLVCIICFSHEVVFKL